MTTQSGRFSGLRSIRYPILAIAWIPSLVLVMIGLVIAGALAYQGSQVRWYNDRFNGASRSAAGFMTGIFAERRLSEAAAVDPAANAGELASARDRVDGALPVFLADIRDLAQVYPAVYLSTAAYLEQLPQKLTPMRERVSTGQIGLIDVSQFYSDITRHVADNLFATSTTAPVPTAASQSSLSVTLLRATDELLDADAVAVAAFSSEGGLNDDEFELLVRREGAARARFTEVEPLLQPNLRADLAALRRSPAWKRVEQAHAVALLTRGGAARDVATPSGSLGGDPSTAVTHEAGRATRPAPPIDPQTWSQDIGKIVESVTDINLRHSAYVASLSVRQGEAQLRRSLYIGAGLLIVGVAVFLVTTAVSSRIVNRLRRLRSQTLTLSRDRLPSIVNRLREGKPADVSAELPALQFGRDEIGQVAQAFDEAQRTAVAAAVREAETRAGLRTVFLDIARRSQAIVHRQLKVLDQAERAQEDPDQLALLFQLDHLSTRARRNAENLVILGGGQAGRQWRNPVPLLEIARSAVSEAEDYTRVQITTLPQVTLHGGAVADVVHLLAELVDNATTFSPPMSRVEVRGNLVGRGVVVEVEDQGLGIEPEQTDQLNELLHDPPDFQVMALADEPRLGLFVVAQLAARHGIRVTLTPSPTYGGTRVVVLLPSALIAGDPLLPQQTVGKDQLRPPVPGVFPAPLQDVGLFEPAARGPGAVDPAARGPGAAGPQPFEAAAEVQVAPVLEPVQTPGTRPELPRRIRQAHLSLLLKDVPVESADPVESFPDIPDAEVARDRLAALQRGTLHGRATDPEA